MKRISLLMCMMFALGMMSCGDIDNMDGPDAAISGCLIDDVTGKPLITEQPNGFRIKMVETSWSDLQHRNISGERLMVHLKTLKYLVLLMMCNRLKVPSFLLIQCR